MQEKQRLDAFLSEKLPNVSRAKLQSGIKGGLVSINGLLQTKSSHKVKWGDNVRCKLPPQQELDAIPEVCPFHPTQLGFVIYTSCIVPIQRSIVRIYQELWAEIVKHAQDSSDKIWLVLLLQLPCAEFTILLAQDIALEIVHEDKHILVLNKVTQACNSQQACLCSF